MNAIHKYLEDILLSINAIEFHVKDIHSLTDYESNLTVRDAVERRLAIIGEATAQINKIDKSVLITDKSKIINLRHILVHDYDLIEYSTIWNVIFHHLPILKSEIQTVLNSII